MIEGGAHPPLLFWADASSQRAARDAIAQRGMPGFADFIC